MKTLRNLFGLGITGAGIGSVVTTISMAALGVENCSVAEFAIWIAASVLIGIATQIVFSDKLILPVATLIHLATCLAIVTATVYICGYVSSYMTFFKIILPMFILIYAVIYVAVFVNTKFNEKAVNKALQKKNGKN